MCSGGDEVRRLALRKGRALAAYAVSAHANWTVAAELDASRIHGVIAVGGAGEGEVRWWQKMGGDDGGDGDERVTLGEGRRVEGRGGAVAG